MKYRYKILEYKRLQKGYIDYLEALGDELTFPEKIDLCGEITRLQMNIERIEAMTYTDVNKESLDYHIQVPAFSN